MNRTWTLHWASAFLLLALLLTSLPWAAFEWARPATRNWLDIHMTFGWTLLAVTAYRLIFGSYVRQLAGWKGVTAGTFVRSILLVATVVVLVAGPFIYRVSPLVRPAHLLGFIPAVAFPSLPHGLHLQVIQLHRTGTYVLLLLLIVHVTQGFMRRGSLQARPVSWLWSGVSASRRRSST